LSTAIALRANQFLLAYEAASVQKKAAFKKGLRETDRCEHRQVAGAVAQFMTLSIRIVRSIPTRLMSPGDDEYGLGEQFPPTPRTSAKHCSNVANPKLRAPPPVPPKL
jgi:hypothetical protein